MGKIQIYIFSFILLGISSCIEPIEIETEDGSGAIVVDGRITNETPPYNIRISRSINIESYNQPPVEGAEVILTNDQGNQETLLEVRPGVYQVQQMQGKIGVTYILNIKTRSGEEIESLPEKMPENSEMDSIYFEYNTQIIQVGQVATRTRYFFEVYVDTPDPGQGTHYLRWENYRIAEFFSQIPAIMAPPPPPPCCYTCYIDYTAPQGAPVANDRLIQGNSFSRIPIVEVDNASPNRLLVRVKQFSITENAFDYWKAINDQRENTGSIFDPPPTIIKGNLINKNNPDELILGFFEASSVTNSSVMINRFSFSAPNRQSINPVGDCRQVDGAYIEVPEEFK